jgi:hypothetical protein
MITALVLGLVFAIGFLVGCGAGMAAGPAKNGTTADLGEQPVAYEARRL